MKPSFLPAMTPRTAFPAIVIALLVAGCQTPTYRLPMDVPGEFKLSDVSKIAIVDFNSLPGDAFSAVAADRETCDIVQRALSASLARSGMWDIVRLDAEQAVAAIDPGVLPNRRFDAIAYGRVWWQFPPERDVLKPELFTLTTKSRVTYLVPETTGESVGSALGGTSSRSGLGGLASSLSSLSSGLDGLVGSLSSPTRSSYATSPKTQTKMVEKHVDLVTEKRDVLESIGHRSREASLMLALSLYRIRGNGMIEKVADTFLVLDQTFLFDNGRYSTRDAAFGPPGAGNAVAASERKEEEKSVVLPASLSTIPPDMQAKLMLAMRAAEDLGRRIAPHKDVRVVAYDFPDAKITKLLNVHAYDAAERYALRSIRTALGAEVAAKVEPLLSYEEKPDYDVPPSPPSDVEKISVPDRNEAAAAVERLVAKRDCVPTLFALALCQEATGRTEEALYTYRYVFRIDPDEASAQGIARCHKALGAAARIAEQARETRKASKKARLD